MSSTELDWFKSSYSSGGDGDCVEIALTPTTIHIRDSKNPQGPHLTTAPAPWTDFLTHLASAEGRREVG
ncbi:DUF397 domain-containing protein [Streptomyces canus]|uniref:DUF397 domain-containing protein n=1 Tax=Streptomyces canus TaxID=58343 RepID=UPI00277D35D7|nr:DUF397 domain-containing protein [Streptomyces canus]MDQ0760499.1 hypothetical protein [Streptomyces canus]